MKAAGVENVAIEPVQGELSDHYDPAHKMLRLSPKVYGGRSLAAVGVAAHEAGHAIQDATHYPAWSCAISSCRWPVSDRPFAGCR